MRKKLLAIVITSILILMNSSLSFSQSDLSPEGADSYIIGHGDILEIVTWKEPDFSREEVIVRMDGKISFPLLNDVMAAGKTPMGLTKEIQSGLKDYVAEPHVTVHVRSAASKRFYILGEVLNPGEYPLTKHLTVLQALALAGGFTEWASKKEIILYRREGGKETVIKIDYKGIAKGKDFSQNVPIRADDTIVVP
jgi:polysaccharide biosynthesis/export protein